MSAYEATVLSIDWANRTAKVRLKTQRKLELTARLSRNIWTHGAETKPTSVGEHGEHVHSLGAEMVVGDLVYVSPLNGRQDQFVILALA